MSDEKPVMSAEQEIEWNRLMQEELAEADRLAAPMFIRQMAIWYAEDEDE